MTGPQGGAPSKIDQVVATRNGQPVTAAERIVEIIRIGGYFEQAAAAAGVSKVTAYSWLRTGADATRRQHLLPDTELTDHEVRCQQFSLDVAMADAEWEAQANATLEQLARGGIVQETVTEKVDADGKLIERSTKRSTTLPSERVIMWRLERKHPDRYGHRVDVTSGGQAFGVDQSTRAAELAEQAGEVLASVTPIETTGDEKPKRKRKPATKAPAKRRRSTG